jgi:polyisoprenoid-binding protein YceI
MMQLTTLRFFRKVIFSTGFANFQSLTIAIDMKTKRIHNILILAATLILGSSLFADEGESMKVFKIDPVHSGVGFKIRHIINQMPGEFTTFSGEIHYDEKNPENSRVVATIEVSSVNTRDKDRDAHLLNEDFFNAPQNPKIEFVSTEWKSKGSNRFDVTGNLTMVGVTKPVTLDVELLGMAEARGVFRSGWTASTTLDRTDWGITYGRPAVGAEVQVDLNIQGHLVP